MSKRKCEDCKGTGIVPCPECLGDGTVEQFCGNPNCSNEQAPYEAGKFEDIECPRCKGDGEVECPECFGEGKYEDG
jgi:RecJ-like exonuclease